MASAKRRARHRYLGAPWSRKRSGLSTTKQERTKQSKPAHTEESRRHFILPLVIKLNGRWAYKHGKLAKQLKRSQR